MSKTRCQSSLWLRSPIFNHSSAAIQLPLALGHDPHAARLTVTVTIFENNVSADIKEATDAVDRMSSAPHDPTEKLQSDAEAIFPVVTPVIVDVMTATHLESLLDRLDGFMKMADIVAEVLLPRFVIC